MRLKQEDDMERDVVVEKQDGSGLGLAGQGLKLAGQGRKKKLKKKCGC